MYYQINICFICSNVVHSWCCASVVLWRICGVVANYDASQARNPGIDSHQHQKDSWHIWRHLRRDTVFSCNLRCRLIFLRGFSRTYRVASLRAGPVGCISYNLYFDCKHVRSVTCDLINEYTFFGVQILLGFFFEDYEDVVAWFSAGSCAGWGLGKRAGSFIKLWELSSL